MPNTLDRQIDNNWLIVTLIALATLLHPTKKPFAAEHAPASTVRGTGEPDAEGFVALFDGKTLAGWRGFKQSTVPKGWTVTDKQIQSDGTGPDLVTNSMYDNFELKFEWKISAGGNSGVIYRVSEDSKETHQTGIEYQLIDASSVAVEVPPVHSTGAIYGLYCKDEKTNRPIGEYNDARIIARGNRIEHWLNGDLVAECEIGSENWIQKVAASKFFDWPGFAANVTGHIALQAHGQPVWFRNIKIKPLKIAAP